MNKGKITLLTLCLIAAFLSCNNDDDGVTTTPIRDRAEQQEKDKDSLIKYFNNHYFNSSEINNLLPNVGINDIVITELIDGETVPTGSTLLINATNLETKTVTYADVEYEYYILRINEGGGTESPTFADNVIVNYEGFTLKNKVFDSSVNAVRFDLTTLIPAWRKVLPQFKVAQFYGEAINVDTNGDGIPDTSDGTLEASNQGTGIMFIPSGLGYFANAVTGISSYSPIIFKFELYKKFENDHDNDGIPSYMEDLNGDGEFIVNTKDLTDDTDDDTDGDGDPDYADIDDDGDGILTKYEDINEDGNFTNDDSNGNGIPNYLDPEDKISNQDP